MKHRNLILAGAAFAVAMFAMPATASAAHAWRTLGIQTVDGARDRDVVRVPGRARFSQIKICVYRGAVRFRDLDVRFANGRSRDLAIRGYFRPRSCTRAIDLPGYRRNIASIAMNYGSTHRFAPGRRHDSRFNRGGRYRFARPVVVVYGR